MAIWALVSELAPTPPVVAISRAMEDIGAGMNMSINFLLLESNQFKIVLDYISHLSNLHVVLLRMRY